MMVKWVNDGEILVNDGEMLVNDGEMSVWSFIIIDEHFAIINKHFTIINDHFTIISLKYIRSFDHNFTDCSSATACWWGGRQLGRTKCPLAWTTTRHGDNMDKDMDMATVPIYYIGALDPDPHITEFQVYGFCADSMCFSCKTYNILNPPTDEHNKKKCKLNHWHNRWASLLCIAPLKKV